MNLALATHIGPDDLRVPGMSKRLGSAVHQLDSLSKQLVDISSDISPHVDKDERGFATRTLSGLGRRTRDSLKWDADQIDKLADAVRAESDLLHQVQGETLDNLRHQWRSARQTFITEIEEINRHRRLQITDGGHQGNHGNNGHHLHDGAQDARVHSHLAMAGFTPDPQQIARHIESKVAEDYAHMLQRYFGVSPAGADMPFAMAVEDGSHLDHVLSKYRHTVRDVMEQWKGLIHRLEVLDDAVQNHVERKMMAVAHVVDGHGPDQSLISDPTALVELATQLQHIGRRVHHARDAVDTIADDLRFGRMQPEEDRDRRSNPFKHSWRQHLGDLAEDLHPVAKEAERIADHMRRVDQEGAHALRQLIRKND